MNILFVVPSLNRAGAERLIVNICNELIKDDNKKVAIYLIDKIVGYATELDSRVIIEGGGVSFNLSIYKKNIIQNSKYVDFINEFQPDIIHSHLYLADILAHSYYYENATYVSHLHNSIIEEYNGFNFKEISKKRMWTNLYELNWLLKRYKKFNTRFIACSAGAEKLHKSNIKIGKLITLANASPLPILNFNKKEINGFVNFIWIGRLTDIKRPQFAIEIAKILKEKGLRFFLKIAGEGAEHSNCIQLINEYSLNDCVEMLGLINDLNPLYNQAEIMIHTSVFEGLPMVFVEAASFGIPIVSTDCMPENEMIKDGINGVIVKSNDPSDFIIPLMEIIENPKEYERLSQGAFDNSKNFSIEKYVEKLLKFYYIS